MAKIVAPLLAGLVAEKIVLHRMVVLLLVAHIGSSEHAQVAMIQVARLKVRMTRRFAKMTTGGEAIYSLIKIWKPWL